MGVFPSLRTKHTVVGTHAHAPVFPISTISTLTWSQQTYRNRGETVQPLTLQGVSQRTHFWMPNKRFQLGFGVVI